MAEIGWGYEVSAAPAGFVVSGVRVTRLPEQCTDVPVAVTLVGAHGVLADVELDRRAPTAPTSVVRVDEVVSAFAHPKV